MGSVTVRDLRNKGGEVLDRVMEGDSFIVTRDGHEVAELRPLPPRTLDASALLARWQHLPIVDPIALRKDIDSALDPSL
jgi:prevent-host-death family protein